MRPFVVSRLAAGTCSSYSASNMGAEYCDECVCVCLWVCVFVRDHMTVARSFCGGVVIHYVLLVLCRPS